MTAPTPPALLIAGHGTRDEAGAEAFRSFVRELGRRHPELPVAGGFIELSPPPLGEAVAELVERGVRRFAAVPLMLVSAGHAKGDIPAALAREKERHPGISYTYGRPLGPHPSLLRVLERRLGQALEGTGWDPAEVTVLLVGRGSTDPDANAEVHRAARLLWEGRGYAGVEPAFVSLAAPDVPSGLDRCARLGARRIVVLPYFLFTGILPDRVREQTRAWAEAHPEAEVRSADVIGPEPELLDLVWERYEEAAKGAVRMNCDACVYRIALPGFEDKVGLPQQPHFHPDDEGHDGHGHGHHHGHTHSHAH
ncbi:MULTISPECIES: sirohydrochlorin chelatase [Streptomyces]|uniref:Cobalamin biosynthesis CbiX protein n=3 Tax=Streptomyces griseoaurantiacus TaxID=68213 RepID=F3NQW6_9ACTN|nr:MULTISPECIES: sirohydrochlorin chelatase [Streptomyces]NJP70944.1 sirohydrochlorin chelatase [Streptomyces sp. C1-2]EGG43950.1 cobalamin biosynthesis CbiX protein [Streptomyces griseoaurantiacus M045]MBA5222135.1 sirohydrochlorin chelatase [Streptomyces griseoaurantiacus]MCF0087520.1 Sirohydrochlorin cobaltochelatase [Streptomyces sp. MH192]MCF0099744.1 Sirohydrochlorin cobaltochelatase [Streptomyces sp. MH191]